MDPLLGDIELFALSYWMPCEGQTLNTSTNQSLFTLIGTTFGETYTIVVTRN